MSRGLLVMMGRKSDNVRREIMALLSHILAATFFQSESPLASGRSVSARKCYNVCMTDTMAEAIEIIRELPDDEQDAIARQLIRLIDLAQSTNIEMASASDAELS